MSDPDENVAGLEARRREVGRKINRLKEGSAARRAFVREALDLDREIVSARAQAKRESERREAERRLRLSERVRPAEVTEVEVLRKYRMVRVYGASRNRLQPHIDEARRLHEEFAILSIGPSIGGQKGRGDVACTLTFGTDEGLEAYLRFAGWDRLSEDGP